jgi:uncharacterized membrane protein YphA (DoxX/SURF4 family)
LHLKSNLVLLGGELRMRLVRVLARLILGGVFIWAAVNKIPEAGSLAETMTRFELLPEPLILPFAYFLPWLELVCGLGLVLGIYVRGASWWAAILLVVFIIALGANLSRGLEVDCGCFGDNPAGTGGNWGVLIRDIVLLFLTFFVIRTGASAR